MAGKAEDRAGQRTGQNAEQGRSRAEGGVDCRAGLGRTWQGRAGQGRGAQGRPGQGKARGRIEGRSEGREQGWGRAAGRVGQGRGQGRGQDVKQGGFIIAFGQQGCLWDAVVQNRKGLRPKIWGLRPRMRPRMGRSHYAEICPGVDNSGTPCACTVECMPTHLLTPRKNIRIGRVVLDSAEMLPLIQATPVLWQPFTTDTAGMRASGFGQW